MTTIIYLIGRAGTGKYTIAQELAKVGNRVADNQLVNNPIFALLDRDGNAIKTPIPGYAWKVIERIRDAVFDFIAMEKENNYVLTNELYETLYDRKIYAQVEEMASKRGSVFVPVKLHISKEENAKRVQNPNRAQRFKTLKLDEELFSKPLLFIDHLNLLELDVSALTATEAAAHILEHVKECKA